MGLSQWSLSPIMQIFKESLMGESEVLMCEYAQIGGIWEPWVLQIMTKQPLALATF